MTWFDDNIIHLDEPRAPNDRNATPHYAFHRQSHCRLQLTAAWPSRHFEATQRSFLDLLVGAYFWGPLGLPHVSMSYSWCRAILNWSEELFRSQNPLMFFPPSSIRNGWSVYANLLGSQSAYVERMLQNKHISSQRKPADQNKLSISEGWTWSCRVWNFNFVAQVIPLYRVLWNLPLVGFGPFQRI